MNNKFKSGDFIFYKDKNGATHSTKVWAVTKHRLIVQNWESGDDDFGHRVSASRYVTPEKCQLQSEWEKENQLSK